MCQQNICFWIFTILWILSGEISQSKKNRLRSLKYSRNINICELKKISKRFNCFFTSRKTRKKWYQISEDPEI